MKTGLMILSYLTAVPATAVGLVVASHYGIESLWPLATVTCVAATSTQIVGGLIVVAFAKIVKFVP